MGSDGYDGFKPGFHIVVAGIQQTSTASEKQVKRFHAGSPTAYPKKTKIYMGCMH